MDHGSVEAVSAIDALFLHGHCLSDYEREEILDYREVYYVGERARKVEAVRGAPRNGGYDDANGRYRGRLLDHVAYRYKLCSTLGKGAFGDCFKAYDFRRQQYVALKIIRNEPRFHRQGKVEVNVLEMLKAADPDDEFSLVHMVDHMLFRGHLVITFELLGNDLYSELRHGGFAGFEQQESREIATDILQCLELLARMQVVHADLKPENILLRPDRANDDDSGSATIVAAAAAAVSAADTGGAAADAWGAAVFGEAGKPGPAVPARGSRCKVIDFGSSCFQHGKIHTYIQSRYYRSPEVVLGLGYGPAIDMWSLGCILVELDSGVPLFSAKNEQDLIVLQLELLGLPADSVLARAKRASDFFDGRRPLRSTDRKGRPHPVGSRALADACKTRDPLFIDFVARCLTWDPAARMTAAEALHHPWVVVASTTEPDAAPIQTSSPKLRRVTDLITASASEMMSELNDSGMSSADEQEVPCAGGDSTWGLNGGAALGLDSMAVC